MLFTMPMSLALLGCAPSFVEEYVEGVRHVTTRLNAKGSGTARLKLPVLDGETAFLSTVTVAPPYQVHFRSVVDPAGAEVFQAFEWNSSPYSKTNAAFVADTVSLNWPVQSGDESLFAGKWEFEFGVVDATDRYVAQPLTFDAMFKDDVDFEAGEIKVSIVYAGGLEDDPELRSAVTEAIVIWEALYADLGIVLTTDVFSYDGSVLGPPALGEEDAYVEISSDTPQRTVALVISDEIEGFPDIFGIAGDIPGPLIPTTRSAVQVSALAASGQDLEFSAEETRLFAETMAHEVLHYVGLYHPVESTWDAWDVLDDTDECGDEDDCDEALGDNLMYPYPICGPGSCVPQSVVTVEQGSVANRYVGVW